MVYNHKTLGPNLCSNTGTEGWNLALILCFSFSNVHEHRFVSYFVSLFQAFMNIAESEEFRSSKNCELTSKPSWIAENVEVVILQMFEWIESRLFFLHGHPPPATTHISGHGDQTETLGMLNECWSKIWHCCPLHASCDLFQDCDWGRKLWMLEEILHFSIYQWKQSR